MDYYSFESHLIIFVLFSIRMEIKTTTYQEEEEEARGPTPYSYSG